MAARFPPVLVNTAEQEAEYVAKGYMPTDKIDPSYFLPKEPAPLVYVPQEYPTWAHGELMADEATHRAKFPADFPDGPPTHAEIEAMLTAPGVVIEKMEDGSIKITTAEGRTHTLPPAPAPGA
jgi:hypothetical protein